VPVKRILEGEQVDAVVSRSSSANPESLEFFVELARRRSATPAPS
jgi:hypothetical protein